MSIPGDEILKEIKELLASAGDLVPEIELAVEELLNRNFLNLVEALNSDKQSLADEVQRLKQQLQQKKKGKTTGKGDNPKQNSDHSSEKQRRDRDKPQTFPAAARHTFKDLTLHAGVECPVEPQKLPPAAVRVEDELLTALSVPKRWTSSRRWCKLRNYSVSAFTATSATGSVDALNSRRSPQAIQEAAASG